MDRPTMIDVEGATLSVDGAKKQVCCMRVGSASSPSSLLSPFCRTLAVLLVFVLGAFVCSAAWLICRTTRTHELYSAPIECTAASTHSPKLRFTPSLRIGGSAPHPFDIDKAHRNRYVASARTPTTPTTLTTTTTATITTIDTCDIFCRGPILHAIQTSTLFNDSKTFVDLTLRSDPTVVYANFLRIPSFEWANRSVLISFLNDNFLPLGTDLLPWQPPDYRMDLPLLATIGDPTMREFASDLNTLWNVLARQIAPAVYEHPERHTMLPLAEPYLIVPGGRFREFYYWDSYWVVRGLLVCNMTTTARLVVHNLLAMVRSNGFVPNGSRKYYLTRSQPPMLTPMSRVLYDHMRGQQQEQCVDDGSTTTTTHSCSFDVNEWLLDALPLLDREYEYWMTPGIHAITVTVRNADDEPVERHVLNRYYSEVDEPRPESYKEDVRTAEELRSSFARHHRRDERQSDALVRRLYCELRASAESGWDFSSRWLRDACNLSTSYTSDLLPVDLNAILYKVEVDLAYLHEQAWTLIGREEHKASMRAYNSAAQRRLDAIHAVLWSPAYDQWIDYDWVAQRPASHGQHVGRFHRVHDDAARRAARAHLYASNFVPLWSGAYRRSRVNVSRVIRALMHSGLFGSVGVLTSLRNSGQQWDFPSAWPPVQHMLIEGIRSAGTDFVPDPIVTKLLLPKDAMEASSRRRSRSSSSDAADQLSFVLASAWMLNNYDAFQRYGVMWEKYSAVQPGQPVSRGEYVVQQGFGWTNGVALIFLHSFASRWNLSSMLDDAERLALFSATISATNVSMC